MDLVIYLYIYLATATPLEVCVEVEIVATAAENDDSRNMLEEEIIERSNIRTEETETNSVADVIQSTGKNIF